MKKSFRRVMAALLSALLLIGCFAPAGLAAVQMPAGYTEQQVEACIPKAERLVASLLSSNPQTANLAGTLYGTLFSDQTLNALFSGIYKGFSEYEGTLKALGIDISVPAVAARLQGYPGVYSILQGKVAWSQALATTVNMWWGVGSRAQFASALSAMLSPLEPLLYTLLCGGTYQANVLISVTGAEGYKNAVAPLLGIIGCPRILTQAEFTAAADADASSMIKNVCAMLFSALDCILAAPVSSLCLYLPPIANYLNGGGVSGTLKTLMEPLQVKVAVFSLPGVSKLMENTDLLSSSSDLTGLLQKADLSAFMGSAGSLTLPKIDLAALAACGSERDGAYVTNRAQTFVLLLTWMADTVKLNRGLLSPAGLDASAVGGFLEQDSSAFVALILKLLTMNGTPTVLNANFSYPAFTPGTTDFTANLGRENYERVLELIDPTLDEFLQEFTDLGTLPETVAKAIYSNRVVSEVAKALYGALDTEETAGIASFLGFAVTPAGVASTLRSSYSSAARAIGAVSKWEDLDTAGVIWGFSDGSKEGFTHTLTALLRPFCPYLRFLLAEGTLTLLGAVTVGGGNGYETVVLPLLEGLGCEPDDMLSYADYKKGGDTQLITGILTPITALLDRLCETPVDTLCGLLPNLIYFMQSDLPQQCIGNLLHPVTALLKDLGMESLLPADLSASMQLDLDLGKTLAEFTADSDLGITLPAPDLQLLGSLGTETKRTGKRGQEYTYIEADRPLVLLTLLRYLLGAVKNSGDPDVLTKLMGDSPMMGAMGGAEGEGADFNMMATYTDKIGAQLAAMSVDETIEWLYDLLFAETPKREETAAAEEIPTVIYQEQKDYTTLKRVIAVVLILALVVGTVIFCAKFDFSAAKEKRKRKKKKKASMNESLKEKSDSYADFKGYYEGL